MIFVCTFFFMRYKTILTTGKCNFIDKIYKRTITEIYTSALLNYYLFFLILKMYFKIVTNISLIRTIDYSNPLTINTIP